MTLTESEHHLWYHSLQLPDITSFLYHLWVSLILILKRVFWWFPPGQQLVNLQSCTPWTICQWTQYCIFTGQIFSLGTCRIFSQDCKYLLGCYWLASQWNENWSCVSTNERTAQPQLSVDTSEHFPIQIFDICPCV